MDRRQFLALSAGLSAIASQSVDAALSLDEVRSGMKTINSDGRVVDDGTDFLKLEQDGYEWYVNQIKTKGGIPRKNSYLRLYDDVNAQEALQNIYLPLTRSSTRANIKWKAILFNSQELNALTPGAGLSFVFDGLIKYCKTEAELVSVLAHEIGHIEHRHAIRRLMADEILKQYGLSHQYGQIENANRLKKRGYDISLSKMMEISLDIFERNFTRMWEHQADAFILKVFVDNGYDLRLASKFFKILGKVYGYEVRGTCLYNTHPETIERVNRIESIARTLSNARRPRGDSDEFRYLKDRIGHINV